MGQRPSSVKAPATALPSSDAIRHDRLCIAVASPLPGSSSPAESVASGRRSSRLRSTSTSSKSAQLAKAEMAAEMAHELMKPPSEDSAPVPRDSICLGQSLRDISINPSLSPSLRRKQRACGQAVDFSPAASTKSPGRSPRSRLHVKSQSSPLPTSECSLVDSSLVDSTIDGTRARLGNAREKIRLMRERWVQHSIPEGAGGENEAPDKKATDPDPGSPLQRQSVDTVNEHGMKVSSRMARRRETLAAVQDIARSAPPAERQSRMQRGATTG